MADIELKTANAFGEPQPVTDEWPGLRVTELTDVVFTSIAARRGTVSDLHARFRGHFGFELPRPGHSSGSGRLTVGWMAQDQWLVLRSDSDPRAELGDALRGLASMTDQSAAWAGLTITGPQTRALLARLVPLDTHPSVFPRDFFSATLCHHMTVLVQSHGERGVTLMVGRSLAGSLLHVIRETANGITAQG